MERDYITQWIDSQIIGKLIAITSWNLTPFSVLRSIEYESFSVPVNQCIPYSEMATDESASIFVVIRRTSLIENEKKYKGYIEKTK
jgi:hypothetical protein